MCTPQWRQTLVARLSDWEKDRIVFVEYNQNMGAIDDCDHLMLFITTRFRSNKWWHVIFTVLLDIFVINGLHTWPPSLAKPGGGSKDNKAHVDPRSHRLDTKDNKHMWIPGLID